MCGVLSTVVISYLLRHVAFLRRLDIAGEAHFVGFVVYGLAISLIAAAAKVMRKRDTIILILSATILWVIFVEVRQVLAMVRFLVFASLVTVAVLAADRAWARSRGWLRVIGGALLPAGLCCVAGVVYYGLAGRFGPSAAATSLSKEMVIGITWGISLGLAVGLGLALGSEVLGWLTNKSS